MSPLRPHKYLIVLFLLALLGPTTSFRPVAASHTLYREDRAPQEFIETGVPLGETAIYDSNGNMLYDSGEPTVFRVPGGTPALGASLRNDPKIQFVNSSNTDTWTVGETVVYDLDGDSRYDANEPVISGTAPALGTLLVEDPAIRYIDSTFNDLYDYNLRGDDSTRSVALPFPFDFFGVNYTRVFVSTNGLITFQFADSAYQDSPALLAAKRAIAPLWDDQRTDLRPETGIFIAVPDPDHFLIRWKTNPYNNSTGFVNYEAVLGRDAVIRFNYGPDTGAIDATVGISDGTNTPGQYFASPIAPSSNNINSFIYTPVSGSRPILLYTITPGSPWLPGEMIVFNASASSDSDGTIVSYLWNFGDGTNATTPVAVHTYSATGPYRVTITIRDDTGFQVTDTIDGKVGRADARLLDAWPEARTLDLDMQQNITLYTRAINIESLQVSVQAVFQITSLKTGNTSSLSSQIMSLATREEAVLSASFTPAAATARYKISVAFYYTPRDPGSAQPGWISAGTFYFRFRAVT